MKGATTSPEGRRVGIAPPEVRNTIFPTYYGEDIVYSL